MTLLPLCAALAVAVLALSRALYVSRRDAAEQRAQADTAVEMFAAVSEELGRTRAAAAGYTPSSPPPAPIADFVTMLYDQRLPPLLLKRPLAEGETRAGFAVRWGLA